mmetsp:Transcript_5875/g.9678  ORF Transcript_5875/g.9678 Transcript_5875/m.9678 type:complete len:232 (+) Transcript_5875:51-746(+)
MGDDEEPQCKVEYIDLPEGADPEETNWIRRAGKCRVTYVNGCTFEGTFDEERIKQGYGVYVWMAPGGEEDDSLQEKARYEGDYKDGLKHGVGKMVYPNGDVYEGEWFENKMQGEGTYTYKKTTDIYSGAWVGNKKHGQGTYEFGVDSSVMTGEWVEGQITTGKWVLKGAAVYEGSFKLGRPFGEGKFTYESGLEQSGSYVEQKPGEDEEPAEEGEVRPPNVAWEGKSIVSF